MKKALSLLLILVLLFAMAPPAHAAKWEITGLNPDFDFDDLRSNMKNIDVGDVYPGTRMLEAATLGGIALDSWPFYLTSDMFLYNGKTLFEWIAENENPIEIIQAVNTPSRLNKMLQVRTRVTTQRDLFEPIEYKTFKVNGPFGDVTFAALDFRFKDRLVSTEELEFEIDMYFAATGSRTDDVRFKTITGTFKNHVTEVFANSVEADTWEGQVIDAQEFVQKIKLVGNEAEDVFAHIKMANGKKVYFVVDTEGDIKDEPIMDKYPSIEWAYTVYQVGLSTISGNFIELAGVDDSYYVYGKNADGTMKYLGRGGELLPLSAKYYISSEKLDLDDEAFEEELPVEEEDEPGYNPSTGI